MKYVCDACGWIYDEAEAGTKFEDLPEDIIAPYIEDAISYYDC